MLRNSDLFVYKAIIQPILNLFKMGQYQSEDLYPRNKPVDTYCKFIAYSIQKLWSCGHLHNPQIHINLTAYAITFIIYVLWSVT